MSRWLIAACNARKCLSGAGFLGCRSSRSVAQRGTPWVKRSLVASLVLDPARESLVSSSGALLLKEALRVAGLDRGLSRALSPWRAARASHDPGKVIADLAAAVAL